MFDDDDYEVIKSIVTLGPLINQKGKRLGQAPRRKACAIIDKVQQGIATPQEITFFKELIERIENARKL